MRVRTSGNTWTRPASMDDDPVKHRLRQPVLDVSRASLNVLSAASSSLKERAQKGQHNLAAEPAYLDTTCSTCSMPAGRIGLDHVKIRLWHLDYSDVNKTFSCINQKRESHDTCHHGGNWLHHSGPGGPFDALTLREGPTALESS